MQSQPSLSPVASASSVRTPSHAPQPVEQKHRSEAKTEVTEPTVQDLSCNMPLLRELAAKGDVDAQTRLGINLWYRHSEEDKKTAKELLCQAAKSHTAAGQCALGICLLEGIERKKEPEAAFKCFQAASENVIGKNYAPAQYFMAMCYERGIGIGEDDKKAVECYEIAAKQNHANALLSLKDCYAYGELNIPINRSIAAQYCKMAADLGSHSGQIAFPSFTYSLENPSEDTQKQTIKKYLKMARKQKDLAPHITPSDLPYEQPHRSSTLLSLNQFEPPASTDEKDEEDFDLTSLSDAGSILRSLFLSKEFVFLDHLIKGMFDLCNIQLLEEKALAGDMDAQLRLHINLELSKSTSDDDSKAIKEFICKAARSDTAVGLCALGACHLFGLERKQDLEAATKCFQAASKQNYVLAQYFLSLSHILPTSRVTNDINLTEALIPCFADKQHDPRAKYILGLCYEYREEKSENYQKALQYYDESAALGFAQAQFAIGLCYAKGKLGVAKNDQKALQYIRLSTNQKFAQAQYALGICHEYGKLGITKNDQEAVILYEMASRQKHSAATDKLKDPKFAKILKALAEEREHKAAEEKARQEKLKAELELKAKLEKEQKEKAELELKAKLEQEQQAKLKADQKLSEEKHRSEAKAEAVEPTVQDLSCNMPLLRELAAKGDVDAQTRLGINLWYRHSEEDKKTAKELLCQAAKSHTAAGQCALGICLLEGIERKKEPEAAFKCFQAASENVIGKNYAPAQCFLAQCYEKGIGVTKDAKKAIQNYEVAANQNNASATFKLGKCYFCGALNLPKNIQTGVLYYERAANLGLPMAQCDLAGMYGSGATPGVTRNDQKCNKYLKMFADTGVPFIFDSEIHLSPTLIQPEANIGLSDRISAFFAACWDRIRCCTTTQPSADPQEADDDPAELKAATAALSSSVQEMTTVVHQQTEQSGKTAKELEELKANHAKLEGKSAEDAKKLAELKSSHAKLEEKSDKDAKELTELKIDHAQLAEEVVHAMQQQDAKLAQSMEASQTAFMEINRQIQTAQASLEGKVSGSQVVMNTLTIDKQREYTAQMEIDFIRRDDDLSAYFFTFFQLLRENWNAYAVTHSGKVALSDKKAINYAVDVINGIGQHIPGVSVVTGIIDKLVALKQFPDRRTAINKVAGFFNPNETISMQVMETLVRKLTIAQIKKIKDPEKKSGFLNLFSRAFTYTRDRLTINDIDSRIKKMAEAQVELLLIAIINGRLRPHPTLRDVPQLFAAIVGTEVPYPENLPAEAIATINANTSASTSAAPVAVYVAVPTAPGDTVLASSTLSMSQSHVAPSPSSTATLLSTLSENLTAMDAKAKKAAEENEKLRAALLRTQEEAKQTQEDAKRAQEEAKKSQELLAQLAAKQAEQQAEQTRQAKLLESLTRTSSAAHATAEQAIRATELTSSRVATVEQTAEATANTVRTTHQQMTDLERETAQMRLETTDVKAKTEAAHEETARIRRDTAIAKAKAEAAHKAIIDSGLSISSGDGNTAQLSLSIAAQHNPVQTGDLPIATQLARVQAQVTEMAEHVERRLEAVETGGQPPGRKRRF